VAIKGLRLPIDAGYFCGSFPAARLTTTIKITITTVITMALTTK
jgi:hypothetical protein